MAEKTGVESNEKALKFQEFLMENDIRAFSTETVDDDKLTVIFRSRIETDGQLLPMAIFIDTSIFVVVRTQIIKNLPKDKHEKLRAYLNELNERFKLFKYYLREDGTIYMDVTLPYLDEGFDPKMVQLTLSLIVQHFAAVYAEIMEHVWGL